MSLWDTNLAGVVVGGAISAAAGLGGALISTVTQGHRDNRAATARAWADWVTLQISTIVELQDQVEVYSVTMAEYRLEKSPEERRAHGIKSLMPLGRIEMLCSRLEDEKLAADVRAWLERVGRVVEAEEAATEPAAEPSDPASTGKDLVQEALGQAIKAYHNQTPRPSRSR